MTEMQRLLLRQDDQTKKIKSTANNTCGKQMKNVNFGNQQLYGAKCISLDK